MKRALPILLFLVAITALLKCSPPKKNDVARIGIEDLSAKSSEVSIRKINMLNLQEIIVAQTTLDSLGQGVLEFHLSSGTFMTLKAGTTTHTLYVEPGYDLKISFNGESTASGSGEAANNYLFHIDPLITKISSLSGRNISELEGTEFEHNLDSLEKSLRKFHNAYLDTVNLDSQVAELFAERNSMRILQIQQAREWNFGARHNFEIPATMRTSDRIPLDSAALAAGVMEYALILQMDMQLNLRVATRESKSIDDELDTERLMVLAERNKIHAQHSPLIREFLFAKKADFWMNDLGLMKEVDSLYVDFKKTYPKSLYLISLEELHNRLVAASPGHKAPVVKGITLSRDSVSSADFMGKVVYIDLWASWCGPCRAEIPFSEKMQAKFKGKDVVFINASVDRDPADWKNALSEYPDWKGVHILTATSIYKTYNINRGIPRYILIDRKGLIVNSDARRPSSPELAVEIQTLLKHEVSN